MLVISRSAMAQRAVLGCCCRTSRYMQQEYVSRSRLDGLTDLEARADHAQYKVSALAKGCGVSKRQFQRFVRLRFGTAPHVWLAQIRLARGIACLKQAGLVKEAATQAGFNHSADFGRCFKQHNGLSPSAFRLLHPANPRTTHP
jgi:transcriptional regulator GlxA family with amidase domain